MSKASKELLSDGKVLNTLVERFTNSPSIDNLESVFLCMIDSDLCVPVKYDKKNNKDVKIMPDWLRVPGENKVYFPVFSNVEESGSDYSKNFEWLNIPLDDCLEFVDNNKNCIGLVLNAFTTPIEITDEALIGLKTILKETREYERVLEQEKEEGIDYSEYE